MLESAGTLMQKAALVWPPEPHTKSPPRGRSVSPNAGLVHWMSMMADPHGPAHEMHYMWNGVENRAGGGRFYQRADEAENKMNHPEHHSTPPLQKGPNVMEEARSPQMDMHSLYGNNRPPSGRGSPPGPSMLVVPQPLSVKSPASLSPAGSTTNGATGRKYQCKMCPQIFLHKSAMQHHAREIHRGELKPHQCQQCLKSFSSNHQLTQHIRIHTGEKPYKCSYCDRRFKQLSHVQQHTRLHTGERPYKCHLPHCGRAFIQLSNLQQHLRNHDSQMERSKNRPFSCTICGKGFASDKSLNTHRAKQHAALIGGASSQSCPICHKICINGEALMEHMRIAHKDPNTAGNPTDKRRLASHLCPICGKTYVNEGSLRKHISSHPESAGSPLRMWPCTVCQSMFTQENGLLHHMEQMRMDPKHQFAAQYVLSRAAAERREKQGSGLSISLLPRNPTNGTMDPIPLHSLSLLSQHHRAAEM